MRKEKKKKWRRESMRFTRGELLSLLEPVSQVKTKNVSMEILKMVRFSVGNDEVEVRATDLETYLVRKMKKETGGEDFSICVPSEKLLSIVREMPEGDIEVGLRGNRFWIDGGSIEYELGTALSEEFPGAPMEGEEIVSFLCLPSRLCRLLEDVFYAASKEETRYCLSGVCFDFFEAPERVCLVASDGHRLAKVELGGEEIENFSLKEKKSFIISSKAVKELTGILKKAGKAGKGEVEGEVEVRVGFSSGYVTVSWSEGNFETRFSSRLVEGDFPDWRSIVPSPDRRLVFFIVDRKRLVQALKRVSLVEDGKFKPVALRLSEEEGLVELRSGGNEAGEGLFSVGEAREILEGIEIGENVPEWFKNGGIRVNAAYLLEGVKPVQGDVVKVEFTGENTPVVVEEEKYMALIMPMVV